MQKKKNEHHTLFKQKETSPAQLYQQTDRHINIHPPNIASYNM